MKQAPISSLVSCLAGNIGVELEESLGDITEVSHFIKVVRSYALLSLHFFKNLRVIGGFSLDETDG